MTKLLTLLSIALLSTALLAADAAPATQPAAIALPTIPGRIFAITDFGAVGDGKTFCTEAIKQAVSACSKAGGGVVLIPATETGGPIFLTGPITLANNLELRVDKGATLQFSQNPDDYPVKGNHHAAAITARGCHDVAITGEGTIDGAGVEWWKAYIRPAKPAAGATPAAPAPTPAANLPRRPDLVQISGCQRVLIQNISIANSPSIAIALSACRDVTIDHIKVSDPADSPTTDGLDLSGQNISISKSTFDVGEDDISLKPSGDGTPDHPLCSNIRIADCAILHGKGIVIGGQTDGCLRSLTVSNISFDGTQYGIKMRSERGRGGLCEDLSYDSLTMTNVKFPIYIASYFPTVPKNAAQDKEQTATATTPVWNNIRISNLTASGALNAGLIVGLPEQPITNVSFTNVNITASRSMEILHAKAVSFTGSHIGVDNGKPVLATDSEVTGIETLSSPGDALP